MKTAMDIPDKEGQKRTGNRRRRLWRIKAGTKIEKQQVSDSFTG